MPAADISEEGLETLIMRHMTGADGLAPVAEGVAAETPDAITAAKADGAGWLAGNPKDYDRAHAFDVPQLFDFLQATQPEKLKKLGIADLQGCQRHQPAEVPARLSNEIGKRGVIDVLRKGVEHGPLHVDLFYGTPSPGNAKAAELFAQNRFSVTRQLRYSTDETQRALDLCLFINGLPIATFELKNSLTKQTVEDAVEQYKRDRDPREMLFRVRPLRGAFRRGRQRGAHVHRAEGKGLVVPAVQQGLERRRGQPAESRRAEDGLSLEGDPHAARADGHPRELRPDRRGKERKTGRKKREQIFPRYHQLDVVRELWPTCREHGAGKRYLIQHSAGSGKSNSIAWLAHQLDRRVGKTASRRRFSIRSSW